jgi:DNA processing protein
MSAVELSVRAARAALAGVRDLRDDDAVIVEAFARAVWSVLVEPGDGVAGRLIEEAGAAEALRRVTAGETPSLAGVAASDLFSALKRWIPRLRADTVETATATARRVGARLLVPGDRDWPTRLGDLGAHAPVALWVRGEPAVLSGDRPTVAVVGARAATSYGEHVAAELASELAASGVTVVSGAAYGIDGVAHRSALRAGGSTAALLAGGVDRPYPTGHAALIESIAVSGALLAETPCGTAPTKWRFLARNRLIAALADATVVVEAGARSGSLNTAAHAAALGRALGAVPGAVTSAASAGCHRVIREFDGALITSAADVRELLGLGASPLFELDDARTDELSRVLDALSTRQSRRVAEVARRAGLTEPEVQGLIALAAVSGDAVEADGGWRRTPSTR